MTKVISSRVFSGLRILRISSWRHGQSQSSSCECFGHGFESDDWQAICQSQQRADSTAERVADNPYIRIRVNLSHVGIQFSRSLIVSVLSPQCLGDASVVAAIRAGSTVAYLVPRPLALLSTTAAEEEVVILLVVCRGSFSVENGSRGTLQPNDNGRVGLIGENVTSQSILFPTKVGTSVERLAHVVPVRHAWLLDIGVGSYQSHGQYGPLVRHVRSRNIVEGPGGRHAGQDVSALPRFGHHGIYHHGPPVG